MRQVMKQHFPEAARSGILKRGC